MKIKDIKPNQKKINIKGKIIEKGEIINFGTNKVVNVILDDDSGRCNVAIYGEDTEKIENG